MHTLTWIFIVINWLSSFFLLFSGIAFGLPKDSAGKLYLFAAVILLFLFGFLGFYLRSTHPYWALLLSGIPAIALLLVTLFYKY